MRKRKRDWAGSAAQRILWQVMMKHGIRRECDETCWKHIRVALLRAKKRGYRLGYEIGRTDGYKEGHEDQMKMRIADAMERNDRTARGQS